MLKKEIELYKHKEEDVAEGGHPFAHCWPLSLNFPRIAVAKEEQEATEAEQVIAEMDRKKQFKQEQRAHLLAQIEETKEAVQKKRESNQTQGQLNLRQALPHLVRQLLETSANAESQYEPLNVVRCRRKHHGMPQSFSFGRTT